MADRQRIGVLGRQRNYPPGRSGCFPRAEFDNAPPLGCRYDSGPGAEWRPGPESKSCCVRVDRSAAVTRRTVVAVTPDDRGSCRSTVGAGSAANDLARLQAGGAHVHPASVTRGDLCAHGLDIRVPATVGAPVRMRDRLPEAGAFGANVADGSHSRELLHVFRGICHRGGSRSEINVVMPAAETTASADRSGRARQPCKGSPTRGDPPNRARTAPDRHVRLDSTDRPSAGSSGVTPAREACRHRPCGWETVLVLRTGGVFAAV